MFGCYRKAEASNPEIYAAAVAAVLSEYPAAVIDYVTDPRTGLPSKSQWLPSVFEVKEACYRHEFFLRRLAAKNNPAPLPPPEAPRDPEEDARIVKGLRELSEHLRRGFGPSSI